MEINLTQPVEINDQTIRIQKLYQTGQYTYKDLQDKFALEDGDIEEILEGIECDNKDLTDEIIQVKKKIFDLEGQVKRLDVDEAKAVTETVNKMDIIRQKSMLFMDRTMDRMDVMLDYVSTARDLRDLVEAHDKLLISAGIAPRFASTQNVINNNVNNDVNLLGRLFEQTTGTALKPKMVGFEEKVKVMVEDGEFEDED